MSWRVIVFDGLVACLVAGLALSEISYGRSPYVVAIGLGMAAAIAARRWWPLPCAFAVAALALGQTLLHLTAPLDERQFASPLPFDLAVLIAIYSVVNYSSRWWHGALAVAAGLVGAWVPSRYAETTWWRQTALLTAVVTAVAALAMAARARRLYVLELEEKTASLERERAHAARAAAADERARIAREMHDIIAHGLAAMIAQTDGAAFAMDSQPEKARQALLTAGSLGRDALREMQRLVAVLRDSHDEYVYARLPGERRTDASGLKQLVTWAKAVGLQPTLKIDGTAFSLPPGVGLAICRIVQEALTNVLKHAGPGTVVTLMLRYRPDVIRVEVLDAGGGLAAVDGGTAGGHGLIGMRERVTLYGGQFSAGPLLNGGWRVRADIPLPVIEEGEAGGP